MRSYSITVAGHSFQIKTATDETYLRRLADEVSRRVKETKLPGSRRDNEFKIVAMVAISLLDELNSARDELDKTRDDAKRFATKMIAKIDELLAHNLS